MKRPRRGMPTMPKDPAVVRYLLRELAAEAKEVEMAEVNMKRAEINLTYQQEIYAAAKKAAGALAELEPADFA